MAAKRFSDESSSASATDQETDQPTEKRMRTSRSSFASVIGEVIMVNSLETFCSALEPVLRKVVSEELDHCLRHKFRSFTRASSMRLQAPQTSSLRLIFSKQPQEPIFTGMKITDSQNNPLQILLVEEWGDSTVPAVVPLSQPMKIEIVALDGDFYSKDPENWTGEEFVNNFVKERTGKRPLLTGELTLSMRDGVAAIGEIEFTDNSSWIRSRKFRIGARVAENSYQGFRIREAMTGPFVVKDHRGELYKKHHPPMLEDEVWRLEKIGKEGAFHKKLSKEGINSVQDFLKLSVVDPSRLRRILGPVMSEKMWEVSIKHARECNMGNKLYIFHGHNYAIFLNPICQLVKAVIDGHIYPAPNMTNITRAYIENLVRQAYTNWSLLEEVEGVVNETALLTQGGPVDEQCSRYPGGMVKSSEGILMESNSVTTSRLADYNGW